MNIRKTIKVRDSFWTIALSVNKSKHETIMEDKIRKGFRKKEFSFHYQPKFKYDYNLKECSIYGAELLVRWMESEEDIPPEIFIPIAEKSGQIIIFGELAIIEACKALQGMQQHKSLDKLVLSINISPNHLITSGFLLFLTNAINLYDVDATKLEIELTETAKIKNYDEIREILSEIKKLGVKLSLDDFGSGYSSLFCLLHLPFDSIKIDRYFTSRMTECDNSQHLLRAIRDIGIQMKKEVIVEGIETIEQLKQLLEIGIYNFQGYFLSKPMDKESFCSFYQSPDIIRYQDRQNILLTKNQ